MRESRSKACRVHRKGYEEVQGNLGAKGQVMSMFTILTAVMIPWIYRHFSKFSKFHTFPPYPLCPK